MKALKQNAFRYEFSVMKCSSVEMVRTPWLDVLSNRHGRIIAANTKESQRTYFFI